MPLCAWLNFSTSGGGGILTSPYNSGGIFMLKGFAHLFEKTKEHVCKTRNVKTTGLIDTVERSCLYNRVIQLCTLDAVLAQHRVDFGTRYNDLKGVSALHHKLLLKYKWPLNEIRSLSLSDAMLALHDELKIETLPAEAFRLLTAIAQEQHFVVFPDLLDEEWDPTFADKLLYNSEDR
ncbi:ECs1072 family phage-associated protein [Serratia quinivorans]|uniref:ECs1072 family phage-associated protein n=1 Tax=Serratia quinivorans TaxID=137545 RepID=UPI003981D284